MNAENMEEIAEIAKEDKVMEQAIEFIKKYRKVMDYEFRRFYR